MKHTAVICLQLLCVAAWGGQNAAPSSHLVFDDNFEGDIIINEVRVPEDGEAMYTYYEALGWRGGAAGYGGIQAHPRAHNYIFSIWDHKKHTAPIRAVHRGPGTLTEKFGGEGTGLKSWNFTLGWKTGVWYTLVSRCWPVGDHTYYGFWARSGETKRWTHLVTMDVAAKDAYFKGGTDAFIEDWLETGVKARTTNLRGGWKRRRDRRWHAFGTGRYSVNSWDLAAGKRSFNFRSSWNGGVARDRTGEFYFMTAGGKETRPTVANPSRHGIERTEKRPAHEAIRIRSARASFTPAGKLLVTWENEAATLPQFDCTVTVHADRAARDKPLARSRAAAPHARQVELTLAEKPPRGDLFVRVECRDILDNKSRPKGIVVRR